MSSKRNSKKASKGASTHADVQSQLESIIQSPKHANTIVDMLDLITDSSTESHVRVQVISGESEGLRDNHSHDMLLLLYVSCWSLPLPFVHCLLVLRAMSD
jgi:hypothetical protein